MNQPQRQKNALISVTNKDGVAEFAAGLSSLGIKVISTGRTADTIRKAGVPVTAVSTVTKFPEILDGRVKTLHWQIYAGILADHSKADHMRVIATEGVDPIDIVVVNLYDFEGKPSIEQIDIGGPTMLRAAAKNAASVVVVVDPVDYDWVLEGLKAGGLSDRERGMLAQKVFRHTSSYDDAIAKWMAQNLNKQTPFLSVPLAGG